MTGKGHRLTSVAAGLFAAAIADPAGLPIPVAVGVAMASVTLPDWAEIPSYRNGMRTSSLIEHRTITHWPFLWFFVIWWGCHVGGWAGAACVGAAAGSLTHILGDAPNPMGIPWLVPYRRLRFGKKGWWKSGQCEILTTVTLTAMAYCAWKYHFIIAAVLDKARS